MAHESHYNDFSSVAGTPSMQGFEPNHELFGQLQAGMEMLGIPSKHQSFNPWSSHDFSSVASSKSYMLPTEAQAAAAAASAGVWPVDDSSVRTLLQPSRGQQLALSLFEPKPADAVGLHLQAHQSLHQSHDSREGFLSRAANNPHHQQQQHFMQEGRGSTHSHPQQPFQLRTSKYLTPAKELLREFCNLGGEESSSKLRAHKGKQLERGGPSSSPSWNYHQSLYTMDLLELQRRKTKLLSMLEEVDKRYRKYCGQMRAVVSSFEAVAGEGAATVYSTLAAKAMSRHFRCLRDAIVGEIWATKKAMGEKDPLAPGTTKGETPRLRLLDQCLRQQKAFQQGGGIMESHPWRPQRGLPERSVTILRAWLFEHFLHPYPSDVDKHILARQTGLSRSQVSNWFINARVRLWKPMVEEMYLEEMKEENNPSSNEHEDSVNPNPNPSCLDDQKPAVPGQLLRNDADSLSSIMNSGSHHRHVDVQRDVTSTKSSSQYHNHQQQQQHHHHSHQAPGADHFGGAVGMDFASYGSYSSSHNLGSGAVSLTLGLQQHSGGGMSLSFSPASQQSLLFSNEHMDNGQPVHFSILDGEAQNLPYRNLMGAQLLHDLTG